MVRHGKSLALLALVSFAALSQESDDGSASAQPMPQMQTHMQAMQEQMARIHGTEDPAERQRLMTEHMTAMHQGMAMMGQMMQGGMSPGSMQQCQSGDTECQLGQMQTQQRMMGQQMGMMQQMMQQMMDHMMEGQAQPAEPLDGAATEDHEEHH